MKDVIALIKEIGEIVVPIAVAYIVFLQIKFNAKQNVIHKQINGMQGKYVAAEKKVSKQEGKDEQIADDKNRDI